jgi:hypothetical protein
MHMRTSYIHLGPPCDGPMVGPFLIGPKKPKIIMKPQQFEKWPLIWMVQLVPRPIF